MDDLLTRLIERIRDGGLGDVFGRYYSIYRAMVTDNKDPKKLGRVKVMVPTLFGDDPLPNWCQCKDFRASGKEYGEFNPPEVDDWVFVQFIEGDTRYPVYSGGWVGEEELSQEYQHDEEGTPRVRGQKDSSGNGIFFDSTPDKEKMWVQTKDHIIMLDSTKEKESISLIHKLGSQIQIDKLGSIKAFTSDGHYISMNSEDGSLAIGSKDGSIIALKDNIVVTDASGKSTAVISEDGVQITTGGDLIAQANSATMKTGSISVDTGSAEIKYKTEMTIEGATGEKLAMGKTQVSLGNASAELVDILSQTLQALSISLTPGYNGPLTTASQFAALYAKILPLKKIG